MNVIGYKIYFWSNENNEPIHVHISKGKLTQNTTKIWLTKTGGCIIANNKSKIPEHELSKLLAIISRHYFLIIKKWKEYYKIETIEKIKFFC